MSGHSGSDVCVSRVIKAPPRSIFQAFLDPGAIATWRPPRGMKARIFAFEPHEGGSYRMSFDHADPEHDVPGKTSEHSDVFQGRFVELVPDRRIVEEVRFESNDPAFAGTMTIITTLAEVEGGTRITVACRNAPPGIAPGDHEKGISSSLANLAAFTE